MAVKTVTMNLFEMDAYVGRELTVSDATHIEICELFPEVDVYPTYRDADSWLLACPARKRPKNVKRFLLNWFRKEKRAIRRQHEKEDAVRREINVGASPI